MTVINILVPAKFTIVATHFLACFVVIGNRDDNVNVNKESSSDSIMGAAILSLICIILEFFVQMSGITMFYDLSNFIVIVLHAVGVMTYSQLSLLSWPSDELWGYWAGFVFVPLIIEIIVALFGNYLFGSAFERRSSRKGN